MNNERERELKDRLDDLMEKDAIAKELQEEKRLEHEEDMFVADL